MTEAQESLVTNNTRLVFFCVNRVRRLGYDIPDRDDMIGIGMLALCKAAVDYRAQHASRATFGVFAYICIMGRIRAASMGRWSKMRMDAIHSLSRPPVDAAAVRSMEASVTLAMTERAARRRVRDAIDASILEATLAGRTSTDEDRILGKTFGKSFEYVRQRRARLLGKEVASWV